MQGLKVKSNLNLKLKGLQGMSRNDKNGNIND